MSQIKNDRFLRTIWREPVDATPIWIMRQAGRYLPEYRQLRQKAGSFLQLCKTPELACEVTLQPLDRFPLDASIIFSDILTIPDAMGLGLYFTEGEGPAFQHPLRHERDIQQLAIPDPEVDLRYVLDAIRLVHKELDSKIPLIGFCGSPWTIACYVVEGKANKSFPAIQSLLNENPKTLHLLLDKLAEAISLHLNAQIKAGADAVMIFDTWGGLLSTPHYQEYSLRYVEKVISLLTRQIGSKRVPVILFTKGGGQWLELMTQSGCDVMGVDWQVNLKTAREQIGNKVALQGNMDPTFLFQSEDVLHDEIARILKEYGAGSGHIFNLGHGIPKEASPEQVAFLIDTVHKLSREYHAGK